MSKTEMVKIMWACLDSFSGAGANRHLALGRCESVHCLPWQRDETKGGRRLSQDPPPVNANAAIVLVPDQPAGGDYEAALLRRFQAGSAQRRRRRRRIGRGEGHT